MGIAVYALIALVGTLGAASDAILNQWARTEQLSWLLAAYAAWIVVATALGFLLKWQYFSFGGAVVLFLLVNTVGAIALDFLLYHRRPGLWEWLGIALAIAAIVCIEKGRQASTDI